MTNDNRGNSFPWTKFHGPNLGYVIEQYDRYVSNEGFIDSELKEIFQKWGPPRSDKELPSLQAPEALTPNPNMDAGKLIKIAKLLDDVRSNGHLAANINPLDEKGGETTSLNLEEYGLNKHDLEAVSARLVWEKAPKNVRTTLDAFNKLNEIYTTKLAFEFDHVKQKEERSWLLQTVEEGLIYRSYTKDERKHILKRLTEVEEFEQFLHKMFVGQKRFSIEGVDMLVPMLDELIREGCQDELNHIVIGMAHRGRVNVLAHVLEKSYNKIFSEFQSATTNKQDAEEVGGWSGDVKYHLGKKRYIKKSESVKTEVTLANNPSHLEFVNPVVEGFARAAQENRSSAGYPEQDVSKAMSIQIHGDAAFPGQGIVTETLNLGELKGYQTGGTIHIIANNMVGFTTDSHDSRSTRYASNIAKGFELPIIHVNADDPEACLAAVSLAYQYRNRFKKSFVIDLVGYRRFGHNEMDDPAVTQPQMYKVIAKHPTVKAIYSAYLQVNEWLSKEEVDKVKQDVQHTLQSEFEKASQMDMNDAAKEIEIPKAVANGIPSLENKVSMEALAELNSELLTWPDGFHVYPKLKRILERRDKALSEHGKVEWALAEILAFATILKDGVPIRLSGQDSERGTFAQRHVVLHDMETNETYSPLHRLTQARAASFAIHNSPLSEAAVVGFEYGYNVFAPETLVIWEAQYGDFSNTAQALFDQFVSAGRAKWGQKSGLVLLLPHGYEGQGPEHSSARPERFLQLAAENNWTVANVTSAAQYFHLLRRQAAILNTEYVRPLVLMTPKGLLRHPMTTSFSTELAEGHFQTVVEQQQLGMQDDKVKRLILTTGKMAIDLALEINADKDQAYLDETHIIRIEQLYPFPLEKVEAIINRYPNLNELVWVQEEPKNMGAWNFILPILYNLAKERLNVSYIGRPERSSPSGGNPIVHKKEQERIVNEALMWNTESKIQEALLVKS